MSTNSAEAAENLPSVEPSGDTTTVVKKEPDKVQEHDAENMEPGTLDSSGLLSPKSYSKRERKQKTWDGFETDMGDKSILANKKEKEVKSVTPRGRGRPPKPKTPVTPGTPQSSEPKKRGRPFKSPAQASKSASTDQGSDKSLPKEGQGANDGIKDGVKDMKDGVFVINENEEKAKTVENAEEMGDDEDQRGPEVVKRRPGRPPKTGRESLGGEQKIEKSTTPQGPKKRGRPFKNTTPSASPLGPDGPASEVSRVKSVAVPKKRGRPFKNPNANVSKLDVSGNDGEEKAVSSEVECETDIISASDTSVIGSPEHSSGRFCSEKELDDISKLVTQMRNGENSVVKRKPGRPPKKSLEAGRSSGERVVDTEAEVVKIATEVSKNDTVDASLEGESVADVREIENEDASVDKPKRGRIPKTLNNTPVPKSDHASVCKSETVDLDTTIDDTDNTPKIKAKKRGRPFKKKQDNLNESREGSLNRSCLSDTDRRDDRDATDDADGDTTVAASQTKKVGRKPRKLKENYVQRSEGEGRTSGRKRKRVSYTALDGGSDDSVSDDVGSEKEEEEEYVVEKTPRVHWKQRKKLESDDKDPKPEIVKKKRTPKITLQAEDIQCVHCSFNGPDIVKHMAVEHQRLWTKENPTGGTSRSDLTVIFKKYRKFLNCPQCNKQVNQLFYYFNHLEWCGRENETFTCPDCGRCGLKARWRKIHERECPALRRTIDSDDDTSEKEQDEDKQKDYGRGHTRNAAKKALTMVNKLAKDVEAADDSSDSSDPDVEIKNEEEYEEEEEEETGDEEIDEKSEDDDDDDDDADDVAYSVMTKRKKKKKTTGSFRRFVSHLPAEDPARLLEYTRYHITYKEALNYHKKYMSDQLFPDWLPRKPDCPVLLASEAQKYLPDPSARSVEFKFSQNKSATVQSLELYESTVCHGFPIFYTGLSVWRLAWCPQNLNSSNDQYLVIVGKSDHSLKMVKCQAYSGPGVIQVWRIKNCRGPGLPSPSLSYTVAHDYGMATDLQWCPSGCYVPTTEQTDVYPRLGLLAVSFTDASIRIFRLFGCPAVGNETSPERRVERHVERCVVTLSMERVNTNESLPLLSEEESEGAPTLKVKPVLTFQPHCTFTKTLTCCCLDWCWAQGHDKIMAGYSDGTVRFYKLSTTSPSLRVNDGSTVLPCHSFFAHGRAVRALSWCGMLDNVIGTSSEDHDLFFWDLNDTNFPISGETVPWLTIYMTKSLWYHGVFVSSDDSYAVNTNRTRYLEPLGLMYTLTTKERKDEIVQYVTMAQPACVWNLSYSHWLNFLVAVDNRGYVLGKPMVDLMVNTPDTKQYRFRLCLFKTTIRQKTDAAESCTCNKPSCEKCQINQTHQSGTVISDNMDSSQSSGSLLNSSQSNKCNDETDQSKCVLQNDTASDTVAKETSAFQEEKCEVSETSAKCLTTSSDEPVAGNTEDKDVSSCPQTDTASSSGAEAVASDCRDSGNKRFFLDFEDFVQVPKCAFETEGVTDLFEENSAAALKSISINPNQLQFTWVAFGGDAGLVRLLNIHQLAPAQFKQYYKQVKKKLS